MSMCLRTKFPAPPAYNTAWRYLLLTIDCYFLLDVVALQHRVIYPSAQSANTTDNNIVRPVDSTVHW